MEQMQVSFVTVVPYGFDFHSTRLLVTQINTLFASRHVEKLKRVLVCVCGDSENGSHIRIFFREKKYKDRLWVCTQRHLTSDVSKLGQAHANEELSRGATGVTIWYPEQWPLTQGEVNRQLELHEAQVEQVLIVQGPV